jgi:hypothetical protein
MVTACGYKYYDQAYIDANPERKKTDTFVRFLLCNQKAITELTNAFYLAGVEQRAQGNYYCYRYYNIFKYLPDPCNNCSYCEGLPDSRVYYATTLYIFWITSQKMRNDPVFAKELLSTRKLTYFNSYTKQYQEMELDNLDIQVLLLYANGAYIQSLYKACTDCFFYLTQAKDFCYLVNIPYDLAGCELKPLKYDGRALRELTFTYSDAYANSTSRKGKPCLLNQCGDKAEK